MTSDSSSHLDDEIAELEAFLRDTPMPDRVRTQQEAELARLRAKRNQLPTTDHRNVATGNTAGTINQSIQSGGLNAQGATIGDDATLAGRDAQRGDVSNQAPNYGAQVGLNLGTMIFGTDPTAEQQRRLVRYLDRVVSRYGMLSLRGIPSAKQALEQVDLATIYVTLATTNRVEFARGTLEQLQQYLDEDGAIRSTADPETALPDRAIIESVRPLVEDHAEPQPDKRSFFGSLFKKQSRIVEPQRAEWLLLRAELAVEAVFRQPYSVIVGDPGSGKSVLLRFLMWDCARRNLDPTAPPFASLPIFVSLRSLAGALATKPASLATSTVLLNLVAQQARDVLGSDAIDDILREALFRGVVVLALDGLDEVPMNATPSVASRQQVVAAVKAFADAYQRHPTTIIVTCRSRAYTPELEHQLGWTVYQLAPFTLGQIRHFLHVFFGEYVSAQLLTPARQSILETVLLTAFKQHDRLAAMASSPLLLTLMAQLLYTDGELPRDRPALYERILELLLDKWDSQREQDSIAAAIGHPLWTSTYLLPLVDQLSYEAHQQASSDDGRGRLKRGVVYERMIDFFTQYGDKQLDPYAATGRCLDYIDQRSGIFVPDNDMQGDYVFAHLTFQEHCAGRYLLLDPIAAADQVMTHRHDDRWHEPILLGLGVIQGKNPSLINDILMRLIARAEQGTPKPIERWYRDLILAATIGADRDWNYLRIQRVAVDHLRPDLIMGLMTLLNDPTQPLPTAERIRAGELLADLGDPRYPVTLDEWRAELAKAQRGDFTGYFCRVPAGEYVIGSRDDDPAARDTEKPQHTITLADDLWLARYPVTNAQWQAWVQAGGQQSSMADEPRFNQPNQPVVAMSWHSVQAWCAWLREQLGIDLRLPTEYEWEAAARSGDDRRYPWGNAWQVDHANSEDTAIGRTSPVGCFAAGASPCGALDMSGNVWEWCADEWRSYPNAAKPFHEQNERVLRGGSYGNKSEQMFCAARVGGRPDYGFNRDDGFRCCVAPRSH